MQHTVLHWLLCSCLFIHNHASRKWPSVLNEAGCRGSFDVYMIMKIYSNNCHNYNDNDDDPNADYDND